MATPSFEASAQAHPLAVQKWLVAAAVMIGAVMTVLDASIVNVSLPYMQKSFAADVRQITWVVTSYLVAVSVTIPMTGWCAEETVHVRNARWMSVTPPGTSSLRTLDDVDGSPVFLCVSSLGNSLRNTAKYNAFAISIPPNAFSPKCVNMKPMFQFHRPATIKTGGAAKCVRVPPMDTLTKRRPKVAYLNIVLGRRS